MLIPVWSRLLDVLFRTDEVAPACIVTVRTTDHASDHDGGGQHDEIMHSARCCTADVLLCSPRDLCVYLQVLMNFARIVCGLFSNKQSRTCYYLTEIPSIFVSACVSTPILYHLSAVAKYSIECLPQAH